MKRSIFAISGILLITLAFRPVGEKPSKWFPQYDFDPAKFKNPPQEFGLMARWWWPGNDVNSDELQREINLLPTTHLPASRYKR
jgi:hypothetical protein